MRARRPDSTAYENAGLGADTAPEFIGSDVTNPALIVHPEGQYRAVHVRADITGER